MEPIAQLGLATAVFLATHCVSSTPLRARLAGMIGENAFLGLYSAVSFVTLGWMIWAYARAPIERLWLGDEFHVWALIVMPLSLWLLVCGVTMPNPSAVRQEAALRKMPEPRGIFRVTRHPLMWSIALWALMHAIVRGDAASLVFFGGLLALALGGTVLLDARKTALGADWMRFAAASSNLPFLAIAQGRNRFRFDEIGWSRTAAALALYLALIFLHPLAFGVRAY